MKLFVESIVTMESTKTIHDQIKQLQNENTELKEKLSKYTNPKRNKKYQETHKEQILQQKREYYQKKKASAEKTE